MLQFSFQFLFQQLGVIVAIVKQHIRNYLDDIFDIIRVNLLFPRLLLLVHLDDNKVSVYLSIYWFHFVSD